MPNCNIDSLDTYTSEDKLFVKHTINSGYGNLQPNEGAICIVNIIQLSDYNLSEVDLGQYKLSETDVTIGEGDSFFSEFFDKVLLSMCENEKAYIKSNIDVDGNELDKYVSKDEVLKFQVHLKSVSRAAAIDELLADEKLEMAEHHKEKGTEIYTKKKLTYSISRFKKALFYLDKINAKCLNPQQSERFKTLSAQCQFNLAAAFLKTQAYDDVIKHCDIGLLIEPKNMKGHFRKGQALAMKNNYMEAIDSFQKALSIDNNNKTIMLEMQKARYVIQKERDMYRKMFSSVI